MTAVSRARLRKVLFIVYLAVIVAGVEASARYLGAAPPYTPQPEVAVKLYYENPNGLVLMRPNAQYYTNGDVPMLINEDGYRDALYPVERSPGSTRILVLGDSLTMGDGVEVYATYPKQLERMFREAGKNVEVLNFGVTATNTLNQLELMKAKALDYHPDLIILGFNLNDYVLWTESMFERGKRTTGADFEIAADGTVTVIYPQRTTMQSLKRALYRNSAVLRVVYGFLRPADPEEFRRRLQRVPQAKVSGAFKAMNEAIIEIARLAADNGIDFAVAILPAMTEFDPREVRRFGQYPHIAYEREVQSLLRGRGVAVFDTLPYFDDLEIRKLTVSRFDPHFNLEGNRIVASALFDFVLNHANTRLSSL
jgi:lysophospholipase L1-like esterase